MAKKKKSEETEVSFEQAFEELQAIVEKMEAGDLSLGDSLSSYEIGIKRLKQCHQALNAAEQKIRQLAELDADGNMETSEFDADSDSASSAKGKGKGKSKKGFSSKQSTKEKTGDELF